MIPKDDEINELLSDIEGLCDEIRDLENLNADLEADRDDWKGIATDAKDELTEVRAERDDALEQNYAVCGAANDRDRLKRKVANLESSRDAWRDTAEARMQELEAVRAERDEAYEDRDRADNDAQVLRDRVIQLRRKNVELIAERDDLGRRFRDYKIQHPENEHRITVLGRELEAANAELRDWEENSEAVHRHQMAYLKRAERAEADVNEWKSWEAQARGRAEKAEAELDELAKEKEQVELQRDDLRSELEYLYEVTEDETEDDYLTAGRVEELESAWFEEFVRGNIIQARANSWFEIAKTMTRARNWWVEIADTESDRADKAEVALEEYKTALRVLGGSKE